MQNFSQYFELIEELLNEDIAAVKKNYPKIPDDTFMQLIALDPTYKEGRDSVGKYGKWILNLYNKGNLKDEDFYKVTDYLNEFEEKRPNFKNKDIGQFKTLPDLARALEEVGEVELSKSQKERQNRKAKQKSDLGSEASLVFEGDGFEVWIPHTYAASCKLGEGSHWCTASTSSDNYYYYYKENYGGEYYILINKTNPNEKYQFHFESGQFMDKYDDQISLGEFFKGHPSLREFFGDIVLKDSEFKSLDEKVKLSLDMDYILKQYERKIKDKLYNTRDTVGIEVISSILGGEGFEYFSSDYAPDYNSYMFDEISESNRKLLYDNFGISSEEDLSQSDYYDDITDAIILAYSRGEESGAESEAFDSIYNWLKEAGFESMETESNGNFELFVGDFIFEPEGYDNEEKACEYIAEKLSDNPLYEPYYGWSGFDKYVFNDELSDRLDEIKQ